MVSARPNEVLVNIGQAAKTELRSKYVASVTDSLAQTASDIKSQYDLSSTDMQSNMAKRTSDAGRCQVAIFRNPRVIDNLEGPFRGYWERRLYFWPRV
jgi:hypothetical protein